MYPIQFPRHMFEYVNSNITYSTTGVEKTYPPRARLQLRFLVGFVVNNEYGFCPYLIYPSYDIFRLFLGEVVVIHCKAKLSGPIYCCVIALK